MSKIHAPKNPAGEENLSNSSYEKRKCPICGEKYGNIPQHIRQGHNDESN